MDLEKKLSELHEAFGEFKKQNDKALSDVKEKGATAADRLAKIDELNETISKLEGEMKSVQTAMARGGQEQGAGDEKETKHSQALMKYLRKGSDMELKALSVDSDEDGGFLVTPQMSAEVVKKVVTRNKNEIK
jgi:HK97 family phage major capsid protein